MRIFAVPETSHHAVCHWLCQWLLSPSKRVHQKGKDTGRASGTLTPYFLFAWMISAASTLFAADPSVLEAEHARVAMIERVAPSVVAIFASSGNGGGSGVLITPDGYALSNFHVTSGSGTFMKCGLNDGKLYDAVIVGIDPTGDVALIKMLGRDDFPAATMGDSDTVQTGDWVFAMGNPFLLATDFSPTVTAGIVSGVRRYQYPAGTILEYTDCIQTDASINPGNSGGPLFSATGQLVGINGRGSFEKRGRVNIGAGYAISINQIKHFLDGLRGGRVVDHATLGALVRTGNDRQVIVDEVLEQSSAYRRGLREGDEIVSFAGRPIGSVNQFKNVLGIYPDGWTVPLVYRREGKRHEALVELRSLHRASELLAKPKGPEAPRQQRPQPPGDPNKKPTPKPQPDDAPHPPGGPAKEAEIPEQWKHLHEEKPGYANYYFNQLEQKRVLAGLSEFMSLSALTGRWKFAGQTADNKPFVATLADAGLGLTIGEKQVYFQPLDNTEPQDEPPGTGGLLIALQHFKQLVTTDPEAFSVVAYVGSQPLDGRGPTVDVLATQAGIVQTRWYFHRQEGRLLGWDSSLGNDVDPCSVRIDSTAEFDGRRCLGTWTVRHGDTTFGTFRNTAVELQAAK